MAPEDYPEAYSVEAQEGSGSPDFGEGYEAGEPFEGQFEVPEYVQSLRDQLNEVREAVQALEVKRWGNPNKPFASYSPPDPIEDMRWQQTMDPLRKEEDRLMEALRDAEWILPPLMEPPHNLPTQAKAKEMLRHGSVHGEPLTKAQRGLFGVIASGRKPRIASSRS